MAAQLADVMDRAEQAVSVVARHLDVSAAFLFGSQADGTADRDSDIDIAVFARGVETWDFLQHVDTATQIQMELGHDIELHFFSADQLEHPDPASFAAYVQKHGVRVSKAAVDRVAEREGEYGGQDAAP